jgi:YfiR/HmsC-like
MSRRRVTALILAGLVAGAARPVAAATEGLPARNQALLLLRVLAYDRNLQARAHGAVTVAVLFRPGDPGSEERRTALVAAFEDVSRDVVVAGLPVRVEAVPYRDAADLETRLDGLHAAIACVDPSLAGATAEIAQVTRRRSVLTATSSRNLVEAGVAIGVVAQAGRAGLIVNLRAARQEGADLDASLLAVSDVIKP